MTLPLSDNPHHLDLLCEALDLGDRRGDITPVAGGFHHRMWRLPTSTGVYAVKQLAPDTDLSGGDNNPLNQSEQIANLFADRGIPSLPALGNCGRYLQLIQHQGYLVYPWTNAKGLPKHRIVIRHLLPTALLPVLSFLGPAAAALLTGSVVIEQVFELPGIGRYFVQAALNRDYTLVMGIVVFYGVLIIVLNFLVDLAYRWLDPRVKL